MPLDDPRYQHKTGIEIRSIFFLTRYQKIGSVLPHFSIMNFLKIFVLIIFGHLFDNRCTKKNVLFLSIQVSCWYLVSFNLLQNFDKKYVFFHFRPLTFQHPYYSMDWFYMKYLKRVTSKTYTKFESGVLKTKGSMTLNNGVLGQNFKLCKFDGPSTNSVFVISV